MSITFLVIRDIVCILAIYVGFVILGNKLLPAFGMSTRKSVDVRLRIAASAVGIVVIVSVLVGVEFPALVEGIQRYVKQNWVLGLLIAMIICCVAVGRFWEFRHYRRVWVILAAYLVLHFLIAVPALGRLGRIEYGHIEELYMFIFAISEGAIIVFALRRVTAPLLKTGE